VNPKITQLLSQIHALEDELRKSREQDTPKQ